MSQKVTVVGLGFGDESSLNLGTWNLLKNTPQIWLRTEKHPVVPWMKQEGIEFHSFDEVYEKHHQFDEVYEEIAEQLIYLAQKHGRVVYAVPGHPMVAERTVQILLQQEVESGIKVEVWGGGSFLDAAFARLQIDPIEGFQLVDGNDLRPHQMNPRMHMLVGQVYDRLVASDVKLSLMEVYPTDHIVTIGTALGIPDLEKIVEVPLFELDHQDGFTDLTSVYVPPVVEERALYRQFNYLVEVIETLRGPDGCPWDQKQTHESLRPYLIEEAYETIEAINNQDEDSLADELGDVLLQILLHAQIGKEEGTFEIRDVIENLTDKMIRRHPHVFGDVQVSNSDQVVANWQEIKKQERGEYAKEESILKGIPKEYPTLLKSFEIQKKAAKVGFDWEQIEGVFAKVREELDELVEAKDQEEREEEFGDLLFSLGSLARWLHVDPEQALVRANQKFLQRFSYLEEKASQLGQPIQEISMHQLDNWWNEAKKFSK